MYPCTQITVGVYQSAPYGPSYLLYKPPTWPQIKHRLRKVLLTRNGGVYRSLFYHHFRDVRNIKGPVFPFLIGHVWDAIFDLYK